MKMNQSINEFVYLVSLKLKLRKVLQLPLPPNSKQMKEYTREKVSLHNGVSSPSVFLIIHNQVVDVTEYRHVHPGRDKVLMKYAGRDATDPFEALYHSSRARKRLKELIVGTIVKDTNM